MPRALKDIDFTRAIALSSCWGILLFLALLLGTVGECAVTEQPLPSIEPVPVAPGPFPPPQEQILSPIPKQFDWMRREVRPNPRLEAQLGLLEGPPQLFMTLSLSEDFSDNFFLTESNRQPGYRTSMDIGTVYRLASGPSFVSLANTINANYEARSGDKNFGFANLSLNAGYQLPRLSLALSESFIRSDSIEEATPVGVRRGRTPFLSNIITPQVRYDLTRTTAVNFAYTNTLVRNESPEPDSAGTVVSAGSPGLADTTAHSFTAGVQHSFTSALSSNGSYTFTTANSTPGDSTTTASTVVGDTRVHAPSLELSYLFGPRTTGSLRAFGTITDESDGGENSQFYGVTVGVRRQLTSFLRGYFAVGPTVLDRENRGPRFFPNWQVSLDSPIPLTRQTSLTLSTQQNLTNTATDVQNVGVVLEQSASLTLSHTVSRDLLASLFANYTRTEFLQGTTGTSTSVQGGTDNFWSAGAGVSYALTQILSLYAGYRYQRANTTGTTTTATTDNFDENRITVSLSVAFPLF
jgi:predicted porin